MERKLADGSSPRPPAQVLVVDDDRGICDCVEMLLDRAGHASVMTHLGDDGLAQLKSREFDPRLRRTTAITFRG